MHSHLESSSGVKDENELHAVLPVDAPSPSDASSTSSDPQETGEEDGLCKEIVLYDPAANGNKEIEPVPDPIQFHPSPLRTYSSPSAPRVLPSIGAFTVQCAECFKWRLMPTKERYEAIRERILEVPFVCQAARAWRPSISCSDPEDISQDGSRLWAIDKPNIAQPPPGWQRVLRIRGEGGTKFADVYYLSPSGKRLRSMVEIQKYLVEHPEYIREGVTLSQFSFQSPKPLQENYVRKRPARCKAPYDSTNVGMSRPLEPVEANPISWAGQNTCTDLQLGGPAVDPSLPLPTYEDPAYPVSPPRKKQARRVTAKQIYSSNPMYNHQHQRQPNIEEPGQSSNLDYNPGQSSNLDYNL